MHLVYPYWMQLYPFYYVIAIVFLGYDPIYQPDYLPSPQLVPTLAIAAPFGSTTHAPPSSTITAPVMNEDSSLARKTTAPEISSGVPGRGSGVNLVSAFSAPVTSVFNAPANTSNSAPSTSSLRISITDVLSDFTIFQRCALGVAPRNTVHSTSETTPGLRREYSPDESNGPRHLPRKCRKDER